MNGYNNKKQKRKTRSERNKSTRYSTKNGQAENGEKATKGATSRNLRSANKLAELPKINEYRQETTNTLTRQRLIARRKTPQLAHTKTSDWVKRVPPPDLQEAKKKSEKITRDMLQLAEKMQRNECAANKDTDPGTVSCSGDPGDVLDVQADKDPEASVQPSNAGDSSASETAAARPTDPNPQTIDNTSAILATPANANAPSNQSSSVDSGFSTSTQRVSILDEDIDNPSLLRSISSIMSKEPKEGCDKVCGVKEYGQQLIKEILSEWTLSKHESEMQDSFLQASAQWPYQQLHLDDYVIQQNQDDEEVDDDEDDDDDKDHQIFDTPLESGDSFFLSAPELQYCLNAEDMDTDNEEDDDVDDPGMSYEYFLTENNLRDRHLRGSKQWSLKAPFEKDQNFEWNSLLDEAESEDFYRFRLHDAERFASKQENHDMFFCSPQKSSRQPSYAYEVEQNPDFDPYDTYPSNGFMDLPTSRHKFKTALQKACEQPPVRKKKLPNLIALLNSHDPDPCPPCPPLWRRPDRGHIPHMQQQARALLASPSAAALVDSPDSGGSPVYQASSFLKKIGL